MLNTPKSFLFLANGQISQIFLVFTELLPNMRLKLPDKIEILFSNDMMHEIANFVLPILIKSYVFSVRASLTCIK